MKHRTNVGILQGNLYGGATAENTYLEAAFDVLWKTNFVQSDADACLFIGHGTKGTTFAAVKIDDFSAAATNRNLLEIYEELSKKYTIRRLVFPRQYLCWTIRRQRDGAVHVSQPAAIQSVIAKMNMEKCNGKHKPYVDRNTLFSANSNDKPATISVKRYEQIL